MLKLDALIERLNEVALPDDEVEEIEKAMFLLDLAYYSPKSHTGEVDFSSFTIDQARRALNELVEYSPDDGGDELENKGNLLVEMNRIADLRQHVMKLKTNKAGKKRFF